MSKPKFKHIKVTILQGSLPEDTGWWSDKDWQRHEEWVEELKASGEYLKPIDVDVSYVPHPIFDTPMKDLPVVSARMVFLDFSNDKP